MPWKPPPEHYAIKNGAPADLEDLLSPRVSLWRRFTRWLYGADDIEAMSARLDLIEERVTAIEASLLPEAEEKPRRGSEWETLG